jgi:hypothetical protein
MGKCLDLHAPRAIYYCMWIFERLLTSWLFWLVALAIGLTIGVREAFYPRHVPEAKLERSAPNDQPVPSGAPGNRSGERK